MAMRKNFQNLGSGCETTRGIEQLKIILERLSVFIRNSHVLDLPFSTIFKFGVVHFRCRFKSFPVFPRFGLMGARLLLRSAHKT